MHTVEQKIVYSTLINRLQILLIVITILAGNSRRIYEIEANGPI